MSDNTNSNKNVRDDEIDLLDLFRRMGRALNRMFNALGKAFLISVVFIIKHWLPLLLSIAAGIGVSYFLKTTSTASFTTDVVFRNNLAQMDKKKIKDISGTTSEIISKINKLRTFCSDPKTLSEALSLNPALVKNISDIGAFWIIDRNKDGIPDNVDYDGSHNIYDTINIRMPGTFDVRVSFNSNLDLVRVRDGIIKFIESDSLNQQRNRLRIAQNKDLLTRLNIDIKELDSLQKVKYFEENRNLKPGKDGQIVFMQEQKTQLFYTDIQLLFVKKQLLETERVLYPGIVTVLRDFSAPTLQNNGTRYYGKQVIPIFFLVMLIVLIFLANRKKLIEVYKKY
jgi:hypothetical protein